VSDKSDWMDFMFICGVFAP